MMTKIIHINEFKCKTGQIIVFFLLFFSINVMAGITFTEHDSIKVVKLLKEGYKYHTSHNKGSLLMLFYGHKLLGVPYVAHTLEVNKTEQLVVNMRQMDCTTFTETVLALARTTIQKSVKWDDFCNNLIMIRYDGGKIRDYTSRNHYFFWWVESNRKLGIIKMPLEGVKSSILGRQKIFLNWMTTHSSSYSMLKGNTQFINEIRNHETSSNGKYISYIKKADIGLAKDKLPWIQNGDILALCTNKKGLDTTHIGIAEWGSDGKLHLLNASQIHKKVVLEKMTLKQYMSNHTVQIGVWVIQPVL